MSSVKKNHFYVINTFHFINVCRSDLDYHKWKDMKDRRWDDEDARETQGSGRFFHPPGLADEQATATSPPIILNNPPVNREEDS